MKIIIAAVALLTVAADSRAQIRASELGSFSQTIDGTKLSMTYSRPRVRGRDVLFGNPKAVQWDEVWTPGANYATTLEVNRAIKLDGHEVKAGAYSVWMVVRKSGNWTMVLDPKVRLYHMEPPDSNAAQVRFSIKPHDAPFVEVLSWWMPDVRINGGTLAMQWGRTRVDMNVEVEPSYSLTMPRADAEAYLGEWQYTEIEDGKEIAGRKLVIDYEDNTLKGRWDTAPRYFKHFALVRIAPDWFAPGVYDEQGQLYEVTKPDLVLEFKRENGKPVSFVARDDQDKVVMTGKRIR